MHERHPSTERGEAHPVTAGLHAACDPELTVRSGAALEFGPGGMGQT